jgi:isochorismate pyruvate lyase
MASAVKVALMARSKFHYIEGSMASSEDCNSLQQVRREIDRIDREIMERIGQRARYVEVTARFKTGEMHVAAPRRQAAMLAEKRQWAGREGLDPAVIEDIYRRPIEYFIARQLGHWKERG